VPERNVSSVQLWLANVAARRLGGLLWTHAPGRNKRIADGGPSSGAGDASS